jgi:hypothetical protein
MEDLAFLPSEGGCFANLLEAVFYGFGKNSRMPSTFSKLLELLFVEDTNKGYPNQHS